MYSTIKRRYTVDEATQFSDKSKVMVALEALREDRTVQKLAAKYKTNPTQLMSWKRQTVDDPTSVFFDKVVKIGKLMLKNDFSH